MLTSAEKLPPTYVEGWSSRESCEKVQYRKLGNTDIMASLLSLGAAHVCAKLTKIEFLDETKTSRKYSPANVVLYGVDEAIKSIIQAIKSGINYIDTSPYYGKGTSEMVLGQALKEVPRQAYYIATKVGRESNCNFDYSAKSIRNSVEESLVRLNVSYIDLLQLHDVEFSNCEIIINESLTQLAQLQAENKIKFIGITGYPLNVLKHIIVKSSVKIDTVLSYCRYTLFDQELSQYLSFFESCQLGIINAASMGMGLFCADRPVPSWHPAPLEIQEACRKAANICKDKNIPIARLILQFVMREPRIGTHLVGMESEWIVHQNIAAMTSKSSKEEEELIDKLLEEVFNKLAIHNWENVELERYRADPVKFINFLSNN